MPFVDEFCEHDLFEEWSVSYGERQRRFEMRLQCGRQDQVSQAKRRKRLQHFGNVAVVWSSYTLETEMDGKISLASSRVTEIFVRKNGRWTNPGWHTDEEK